MITEVLQPCCSNALCIMNTFFQQRGVNKYGWCRDSSGWWRDSAKKRGVGAPYPHQIRKTAPNSSNEVSIRLRGFPHWIFLFHYTLLTNSANLRVAGTSARSQPYFVMWPNLVQKVVGTRYHKKKRYGNAVPTRSHLLHPWLMVIHWLLHSFS